MLLLKYQGGGPLKKFKPKNPFVTLQPFYTNPTVGFGLSSPSLELGLEGSYGKKKEWLLNPHIGVGYNTPAGKLPLTGGFNATYKGMANANRTGNAVINLGLGYNRAGGLRGFTGGFDAGYQFNFGAKNRRYGEIKPGAFAGSLMPYAGANTANALIYGGRGNFEWRPKFSNKAPFTVFGGANLNFAPTGKAILGGDIDPQNEGDSVKFKPTFGAHLGIKVPLHRIKENLPTFNRKSLSYPEDPQPLPGDFTYTQRIPEFTEKGKSVLGSYDEDFVNFAGRIMNFGKNLTQNKFVTDELREDDPEFPFLGKFYTNKNFNND
jgi:hypothetical protein